jgi:hypothetical protein
MLIIDLPINELAGEATINGQPVEYKIKRDRFWFRAPGASNAWDKRRIIQQMRNGNLTTYACTGEDGSGIVITP